MIPDWKHADIQVHLKKAILAAAPDEATLQSLVDEIHSLQLKSKDAEEHTARLLLMLGEGILMDKWKLKRKRR